MQSFIGILGAFIFCFLIIFGIVKPLTDLIKKRQKKYRDLVMNESHEKELERQRSEKIRLEIEYKRWKQDNPEYDPNKDPVSHDFLKDKKPKPLSKKEKLELKYKEKISNPDYNLFLDQDFDLHAKRLSQFRRSKWRGEIYYMGQRGGIYTLTEGGTRNYKY